MTLSRTHRWLFVKHALAFPRSSGHDVHTYYLMRALIEAGHEVALATVVEPSDTALDGLALTQHVALDRLPVTQQQADAVRLTYSQERFRSYWGIERRRIAAVALAASQLQADAVVVSGLDVLPYLAGVRGARRIWYAADEWLWHHLSQVQPQAPATWHNLRDGAIKALYERAFAPCVDDAWVVSAADRRAMRWVAGARRATILANGVDANHFAPRDVPTTPRSCVFWGRLDFGPNQQALHWFCRHVWPQVRAEFPDARFTILGFQPTADIVALGQHDGVRLCADLPDIRDEICGHQVVVLPFVSGGGMKNKLLEAAALGRPIVCSPAACNGLAERSSAPLSVCHRPADWRRALAAFWHDAPHRDELGASARDWVVQHHSWHAAGQIAATSLGHDVPSTAHPLCSNAP